MISMTNIITLIGGILGSLIAVFTISNIVYYTKSQVDDKFKEANLALTTEKESVLKEFKTEKTLVLNEVKSTVDTFSSQINKKVESLETKLDDKLGKLLVAIFESKQEYKNNFIEFTTTSNSIKEELMKDYINRYNTLLTLMNGKTDQKDFNRLELKVDSLTESLAELKTIIEIKVNKKD